MVESGPVLMMSCGNTACRRLAGRGPADLEVTETDPFDAITNPIPSLLCCAMASCETKATTIKANSTRI